MRLSITVFSRLRTALATLCLGLPCAVQGATNPVPADEQSLLNGTELFELYCTECHGWGGGAQFDAIYDTADSIDFPDSTDLADPTDLVDMSDVTDVTDLTDVIDEFYATDQELYYGDSSDPEWSGQGDRMYGATDLTDPEAYYNGTSEEDIFNSIAYGAGIAMPAWRSRLGSDEAVWDLVNYIHSLWDEWEE